MVFVSKQSVTLAASRLAVADDAGILLRDIKGEHFVAHFGLSCFGGEEFIHLEWLPLRLLVGWVLSLRMQHIL